jgi:hypothetical protein
VTNPAIHISEGAGVFMYQSDDTLRDPSEHYRYTIYGGPNFLLEAVPEPGTGILFGSVILALLGTAKFRFPGRGFRKILR